MQISEKWDFPKGPRAPVWHPHPLREGHLFPFVIKHSKWRFSVPEDPWISHTTEHPGFTGYVKMQWEFIFHVLSWKNWPFEVSWLNNTPLMGSGVRCKPLMFSILAFKRGHFIITSQSAVGVELHEKGKSRNWIASYGILTRMAFAWQIVWGWHLLVPSTLGAEPTPPQASPHNKHWRKL